MPPPPDDGSFGQSVVDATIRHAVYLTRLDNGVIDRMLKVIREVQADINKQIANSPPLSTARRLERLQASVAELHGELVRQAHGVLTSELGALAAYEVDFTRRMFHEAARFAEVEVVFDKVTAADVRSAANAKPFQGPHLRWATKNQHIREWGRRCLQRMQSEIAIGFVEGQSIPNITKRIRAVGAIDERTASAIARTAVNHYASTARETYYAANSDVIVKQRWMAILDSRTCVICQALDGKVMVPGKKDGPRPPSHPNCRCVLSPVVSPDIDPDFPKAPEWNDWLRTQPKGFVSDVLGPTRAKLYLDGKLNLDKFIDARSRPYTLDDLKRVEAGAFERAGL